MEYCNVCCSKYNHQKHKQVTCAFCDFDACRECIQKYLLSTTENPHCMSCKHPHDRAFVDSFCTKRFRNVEYKNHRENILFERELARMPETQGYVKYIKKRNELMDLTNKLTDAYIIERANYYKNHGKPIACHYRIAMTGIRQIIDMCRFHLVRLHSNQNVEETKPTKFVRQCPIEECRGFLDETWVCGVCSKEFCDACGEELLDGHVCDKDLVETMKLIKRDTKPCPKCSTMIHKIDGCAQMWCTSCHTAFDWRTGEIAIGRIHNPHFLQFKKRSRDHADIPCGGRPSVRELDELNAPTAIKQLVRECANLEYEMNWKYALPMREHYNRYYRTQYLMGKMSKEYMKKVLQRDDKKHEKMTDIRNILQMFVDTAGDLCRDWILHREDEQRIFQTIMELEKYTNDVIRVIWSRYNCCVPRFINSSVHGNW